jgi:thiosulfate/3-mercaptopyruvate sulfurtransferase
VIRALVARRRVSKHLASRPKTHLSPRYEEKSAVKITFKLIIVVLVLSAIDAAAGDTRYARPELLLEPSELAKSEASSQFVILDVRPQEEYDQGHVPGARRVDHDSWKKAYAQDNSAKDWGKRIGEISIGPDSTVVVYDDKGMKDAARIWWILKYWSVEDARLLNGGWKGWKSSGLPTTEQPAPTPARVVFKATPRSNRLATMEQILDRLQGDNLQIVDARSQDEFCGINKRDNKRGGAIPEAKHLEWSNLIDQDTQRFKSPDQLRRLFDEAGIDLNRPTASHCNGGGRAAVMAFGLELMGASEVRNYYRGWGEWGNSDDTPVIVPKNPQ